VNCFTIPAALALNLLALSALHQSVEVALRVVLAALVVEPVGHLVADHGADPAVVDGVVGLGSKNGRLQDARREHDLVPRWGCSRR
jgi:hypothetical protein